MNELKIFDNPKFGKIRMLDEDGRVLFCGKDVAGALGYSNTKDAVQRHCKGVVKRDLPHPQSSGKSIEMNFIPEGDVYRLAAKSELPGAEEFESWIFDEILPSLRQTGCYMVAAPNPEPKRNAGEAASLIKVLDRIAIAKNCTPQERSEVAYAVCLQTGISLPECFIAPPRYEQIALMVRA